MYVRILFVMIIIWTGFGQAEIINFSKLKKENHEVFTYRRNLFLPEISARPESDSPRQPNRIPDQKQPEEAQKQVKKEVRQAVFFEGYIEKNNRFIALISVNGEFFSVGEGDTIMDKIKIVKIYRNRIICEVESQQVEIPIKGENDE